MNTINNNSGHKNALFAGISYFVLAVVGIFGMMYALPQIKVEGDILQTIINLNARPFMFRIGITSMLIMNVASIMLVIYLYRLLSHINKTMAMSMVIIMLFGAVVSTMNETNHFAMMIINGLESFSVLEKQSLIELFVEIHHHGSYIAVIFWGLWLFPLGGLVFSLNTTVSKIIGIALVIAGLGYTLDSFFLFVYPEWQIPTLSDYMSYGEILFMLWLLLKSKHIEQLARHKRAKLI